MDGIIIFPTFTIQMIDMIDTKIIPSVMTEFQVGAILEDSWGYEQTNIDFYCIIKRSGDWVTVLPMTSKSDGMDMLYMSKKNEPGEIVWSAKPIRKKIYKSKEAYRFGKELGFSFRNYACGGWCNLWDGKPTTSTHYA